jgi:hypothetical protein
MKVLGGDDFDSDLEPKDVNSDGEEVPKKRDSKSKRKEQTKVTGRTGIDVGVAPTANKIGKFVSHYFANIVLSEFDKRECCSFCYQRNSRRQIRNRKPHP